MRRPLSVLIIEDSEDDALLSVLELQRGGFDVFHERIETAEAMRAALSGKSWDVVISDYSMPHFSGLEALKILQESGLDFPFILISGVAGEDLGVEAMRCGAHDYLMKKHLARLAPAVERELRQAETRGERRLAEDALRLRTEALDAAANGILITNREGSIIWMNAAVPALTGYTEAELLGQNPRMLKSGRQDEAFYSNLWTTILDGQIWRGEIVNRRKDGTLYTQETTITPVRNRSGDITSFIAVKQDVTKQKKLEAQLRGAQKMEAVGRLAAGVADDFNNLLTTILVYSNLGLESLDESMHYYWEQVNKAGRKAALLTQQLLAFSRGQIVQPKVLDLNDVVAGMHKTLRSVIGEGVDVVNLFGRDLWGVRADPGQVEQIITNLAANARDAMAGGGKLRIETANVELDEKYARNHEPVAAGRYVRLALTDNGCGMDKDIQAHVFEPFFTTKELSKGTGLGLATVYGIVKQSRGYVWFHSEPGKGSTFEIYLPALVGDHQERSESVRVRATPSGGSE